ncbi:MAG: N-acetyltransferase [Chloroflexota bacterium]|mgnify:CR=1 FL=1|nr:N-acetyltransferase [Chloroflexota bacterium]
MSNAVIVRKVETPSDFKAFFEFPWLAYKNDPNWVPPLVSIRRDLFDKQKNPAWEYCEGDLFAAWRGDQIVGTIAAFINRRHNEFHDERVGWFGAFEVYDDREAASALLNTATQWVKDAGYPILRGPQTFTTHDECGLLVEGFDKPPVLLYPYNPAHYVGHIEAAGFHKAMDTYGFYINRQATLARGLDDRLARLAKGIMKRNKVTVRSIDRKNLKTEFALFKELYNVAWERNWGFVPMTPRELDALVASLGTFFDADLAFFAYVDGQPAGFVLAVPNFNEVLIKAYPQPGTPEPLTLLRALWHWKLRPSIRGVRVPLMGVKEAYRGKGVDVVLYNQALRAMLDNSRYDYCDSGWILESNQNMVSIAKNFGQEIYKVFRFYEKMV